MLICPICDIPGNHLQEQDCISALRRRYLSAQRMLAAHTKSYNAFRQHNERLRLQVRQERKARRELEVRVSRLDAAVISLRLILDRKSTEHKNSLRKHRVLAGRLLRYTTDLAHSTGITKGSALGKTKQP